MRKSALILLLVALSVMIATVANAERGGSIEPNSTGIHASFRP